jgi:hypothetical protein
MSTYIEVQDNFTAPMFSVHDSSQRQSNIPSPYGSVFSTQQARQDGVGGKTGWEDASDYLLCLACLGQLLLPCFRELGVCVVGSEVGGQLGEVRMLQGPPPTLHKANPTW